MHCMTRIVAIDELVHSSVAKGRLSLGCHIPRAAAAGAGSITRGQNHLASPVGFLTLTARAPILEVIACRAFAGGWPSPWGSPKKWMSAMTVAWPTVTCSRCLDRTSPVKKRIFSSAAIAAVKVGTLPGADSQPRSTLLGSSCVTQIPTRSPCKPMR